MAPIQLFPEPILPRAGQALSLREPTGGTICGVASPLELGEPSPGEPSWVETRSRQRAELFTCPLADLGGQAPVSGRKTKAGLGRTLVETRTSGVARWGSSSPGTQEAPAGLSRAGSDPRELFSRRAGPFASRGAARRSFHWADGAEMGQSPGLINAWSTQQGAALGSVKVRGKAGPESRGVQEGPRGLQRTLDGTFQAGEISHRMCPFEGSALSLLNLRLAARLPRLRSKIRVSARRGAPGDRASPPGLSAVAQGSSSVVRGAQIAASPGAVRPAKPPRAPAPHTHSSAKSFLFQTRSWILLGRPLPERLGIAISQHKVEFMTSPSTGLHSPLGKNGMERGWSCWKDTRVILSIAKGQPLLTLCQF